MESRRDWLTRPGCAARGARQTRLAAEYATCIPQFCFDGYSYSVALGFPAHKFCQKCCQNYQQSTAHRNTAMEDDAVIVLSDSEQVLQEAPAPKRARRAAEEADAGVELVAPAPAPKHAAGGDDELDDDAELAIVGTVGDGAHARRAGVATGAQARALARRAAAATVRPARRGPG